MTALAVPAYFHPARDAADWARLSATPDVGLVVVNPASGFGTGPDPAYGPVCAALRARGVVVAGYVDTAYARRPPRDVLAEAEAYRCHYGVDAVFLDQVTSAAATLGYYARLAERLRASGAAVVLNPGVPPDPGYRALAEIVVTFEGPWSDYRRPRAADPPGPGRTCHLVHTTPPGAERAAWRRARRRADLAYVTERALPNPWDGLPAHGEPA